jgi:aldehyde dehydrogenase
VFFADVADKNDKFYDKALEGITLYAFNSGEVCTCPSRALVQDSFYDSFMADAVARTEKIIMGNPLDTDTQMGAQVSKGQMETILDYIEIGKKEGATVLTGGGQAVLDGDLAGGYYVQPTILAGTNDMRVFQEEIFGPVLAVARFTDYDDAISIANDTVFGLGAGVWSRNGNITYRAGRDIQAGRVWVNNYHAYSAHSSFGGYKDSGIGRETHLMVLEHYQQTKNLLVSYSENKIGFF